MSFVVPKFSRAQVNRAGDILINPAASDEERAFADEVLANWRASHGYPMNTFQATLRGKLKNVDGKAIVAQRLKRTPSIVLKLQRFHGMKLSRMQDIGGLRAVVSSVSRVRELESSYRNSRFQHKLISSKDYLKEPKEDGYRGIHLIYKYVNPIAAEYNDLSLELQIRTKLQHAWATAVETMGTFLGQALKAGQGEERWRNFFSVAGAVLAEFEKTEPVPGYAGCTRAELHEILFQSERELRVLDKLDGFAIATDRIVTQRGQGGYHLITLDSQNRTVKIQPFSVTRLEEANLEYAAVEARAKAGEPVEAVLVSAGPIEDLRKAYPNYFLDTKVFISQLRRFIDERRRLREK